MQGPGPGRVSVAVVIPTLNEAKSIGKCIDSLESNSSPDLAIELIIIDGGSRDGTPEIVAGLAEHYGNISLISSKVANTSVQRNLGIASTKSDVVIIFSGHATAAQDFIPTIVRKLVSSGPDVAGVGCGLEFPPDNRSVVSLSSSLVTKSVLGGSAMRPYDTARAEGPSASVPFCAYRRIVLERVGMFDASNPFGDDADLNARIRRAGQKLVFTTDTRVYYSPPSTVRRFALQMFRYGRARVRIMVKNRRLGNPLYLMPLIAILYAAGLVLATILRPQVYPLLVFSAVAYLVAVFLSSILSAAGKGRPALLAAMPLLYVIQLATYGSGMIVELVAGAARIDSTRRSEVTSAEADGSFLRPIVPEPNGEVLENGRNMIFVGMVFYATVGGCQT